MTNPSNGKYDFGKIYNHSDASHYINSLVKLSYRDPDYLSRSMHLIENLSDSKKNGDRLRIIDLCCGYGLNSCLLRFGIRGGEMLRMLDQLEGLKPVTNYELVGLDTAANALQFGMAANAFDLTLNCNLEQDDPRANEADIIAKADVIVSTGSLSYISERTIERMLSCIARSRPLLVMFWPLMGHDCTKIVDCLEDYGFKVSIGSRLLWHREFASQDERESLLSRKSLSARLPELSKMKAGVYVTSIVGRRHLPRARPSSQSEAFTVYT